MDVAVTLTAQLMFSFIITKGRFISFYFTPPDYMHPAPPFHSKLSLDLCHYTVF